MTRVEPEVATTDAGRLARPARRQQLLSAALEVFVETGYHASSMGDVADRAGVSKPVLYQHFEGKLELYLALLDEQLAEMASTVRTALASTDSNRERVEAVTSAFFEFVDRRDGAYRLVFESDLIGDERVRERLARTTDLCAAPIADVIETATGLSIAEATLLGAALVGQAQVSARAWLTAGRPIPRADAARLVATLSWRGVRGFPAHGHVGASG